MPVTLPSRVSRTVTRPRSVATGRIAAVLAPRRRAVGLDRHHLRALALAAGSEQPAGDVALALQPQVVRRHRQRGVVVQQRGQGRDVVALEGVDVLGRQLLLVVRARRDDVGVVEALLAERGAGPLQGAVHGRDRRVEQLGDLLGLPPQHLAQDQHGALLRRQVLQGADERQADRLLGDGDLTGVALGDRPAVGDRLDPRRLAARRQRRPLGHLRLAEVHRAGPALLAAEHVEADVGGDPVEPRPQRRPALERVVVLPGPDHRLLHGVLGLEPGAEHPVAVGDQLAAVLLELPVEREIDGVGHGCHRTRDRRRPGPGCAWRARACGAMRPNDHWPSHATVA